MNSLTKIKDVSNKYDVTARTLRYYEDMGLITSSRSEDYAYRLYDERAIERLEQILILGQHLSRGQMRKMQKVAQRMR